MFYEKIKETEIKGEYLLCNEQNDITPINKMTYLKMDQMYFPNNIICYKWRSMLIPPQKLAYPLKYNCAIKMM